MQKSQNGFTHIELVVVIVLLGILGVTALAKFQDLSADAQTAANQGVASEISSGSSINYAQSLIGTAGTTVGDSGDCSTLAGSLLTTGIPADITVSGTIVCAAIGNVDSTNCSVSGTGGGTAATVTFICTST